MSHTHLYNTLYHITLLPGYPTLTYILLYTLLLYYPGIPHSPIYYFIPYYFITRVSHTHLYNTLYLITLLTRVSHTHLYNTLYLITLYLVTLFPRYPTLTYIILYTLLLYYPGIPHSPVFSAVRCPRSRPSRSYGPASVR